MIKASFQIMIFISSMFFTFLCCYMVYIAVTDKGESATKPSTYFFDLPDQFCSCKEGLPQ